MAERASQVGVVKSGRRTTAARDGMKRALAELRRFALSYPGAREDFPWGERVVKVRNKVFVFIVVAPQAMVARLSTPASGEPTRRSSRRPTRRRAGEV